MKLNMIWKLGGLVSLILCIVIYNTIRKRDNLYTRPVDKNYLLKLKWTGGCYDNVMHYCVQSTRSSLDMLDKSCENNLCPSVGVYLVQSITLFLLDRF